jgi:hypothetical protein
MGGVPAFLLTRFFFFFFFRIREVLLFLKLFFLLFSIFLTFSRHATGCSGHWHLCWPPGRNWIVRCVSWRSSCNHEYAWDLLLCFIFLCCGDLTSLSQTFRAKDQFPRLCDRRWHWRHDRAADWRPGRLRVCSCWSDHRSDGRYV